MLSQATRARAAASPFGNFALLARLARGDIGDLFLARRIGAGGFEKLVVIKRLRPELAGDSPLTELFYGEARIAARIDHPNVRQVYELGEIDGRLFIALEYLEGVPLVELLLARRRDPRLADHRLTAAMISQVCEGLHAAHTLRDKSGNGVVHGDLNPRGIFVTSSGYAKVLDFDIVEIRSALAARHGFVRRTCAYMSPEQVRGAPIDHRSDIFSLGVVAWEAVTGRRLFKQRTKELTQLAINQGAIPRASEFSPSISGLLDEAIMKALSRDPAFRYHSAREFGMALEKAAHDEGPPLTPLAIASLVQEAFADDLATQREFVRRARHDGDQSLAIDEEVTELDPEPMADVDDWSPDTNAQTNVASGFRAAMALAREQRPPPERFGASVDDPFSEVEVLPEDIVGEEPPRPLSWQESSSMIRVPLPPDETNPADLPMLEQDEEEGESGVVQIEASSSWPHDDSYVEVVDHARADTSGVVLRPGGRARSYSSSTLHPAMERVRRRKRERTWLIPAIASALAAAALTYFVLGASEDDPASGTSAPAVVVESGGDAVDRAAARGDILPEAGSFDTVPPAPAADGEEPADDEPEGAAAAVLDSAEPAKSEDEDSEPEEKTADPAPVKRADRDPAPKKSTPKKSTPKKSTPRRKSAPRRESKASNSGEPGSLTLASEPYATVYIDGQKKGFTPLVNVPLEAGKHRIKLVNSADQSVKTMTIRVDPGQTVRRKVTW